MKTATFFQAALVLGAAAVMATSCNKEEKANVLTDDGLKSVVLKIDLGQTATKAMEPSDSWNTVEGSEVTPDNIAIYFTDANGIIKYAYKAEPNSTEKALTVWENFRTGVRFIGMEGISRVYAIANGDDLVQFTNGEFISKGSTSTNINTFNVDIESSGANLDQFSVPYAGADVTLEDAGTVNEETDEVVIDPDGKGGPYYSANISIRPVLSRLEINKVSIQESGTLYFSVNAEAGVLERCNADDDKAMYKFDYSGFDAVLTGVYMSNFYRDAKLIPVPSSLESWGIFANPGGTSPIVAGDWAALASETELMDIARYTGWDGDSYKALVASSYESTSGSIHSLFDGSKNGGNKVIPFHFLFPYDITDTEAVSISPVADAATPNLSFQFIPVENKDIKIANYQYNNNGVWEDITDQSIITMLEGEVMWPHTVGQTNEEVYANVVNFSSDSDGNNIVDITTGKIYRIQEVLVTPDALATTTQSTDASNIIVEVSIIPFTAENVYPVFE